MRAGIFFHYIQTVSVSSALQMWAPSWPSVCNTSLMGMQAAVAAALCSASGYEIENVKVQVKGVVAGWLTATAAPRERLHAAEQLYARTCVSACVGESSQCSRGRRSIGC